MRFLIAFTAILGYAAAGLLPAPLVYGANAGDVQAAVIDATVAANDNARALSEGQLNAAENVLQVNSEAARQAVETNRNLQENAYWGSVAASQNYVAAAQSQAAAIDGAAAAARAAQLAAPIAPIAPIAPLAYAGYGLGAYGVAPYGVAPYGLGYRAW